MHLWKSFAVVALAAASLPGVAAAAIFTGSWSVAANHTDPGLVVSTAPSAATFSTDLEVGESWSFDLFHIWTDESDVAAREDMKPRPISVHFSFSDPIASGSASGTTAGERSFFGIVHNGRLSWGEPLVLAFGEGNSGQLSLFLSDTVFNAGFFGLSEGYKYGATVSARLSYDSAAMPAPVPVPTALPLLVGGLGVFGLVARRRKTISA